MGSGRTSQLSLLQRDMLIEHLDTTVSVQRHFDPYRNKIRRQLVDAGLLQLDRPCFPNYTSLTDRGRERLCAILADYADALARSGFTGYELPLAKPAIGTKIAYSANVAAPLPPYPVT